jgi:hypothetical protein
MKHKASRLFQKIVRPLSDIAPTSNLLVASLLPVDVEGFDLEVLKLNDWDSFYPRVICIENDNLQWGKTEIRGTKFLNQP